jgi:hypothetical protein
MMSPQQFIRWLDLQLPAILFVLAFTGGAWEALRSRLGRGGPFPREFHLPAIFWPFAAAIAFSVPLVAAWSGAFSDECTAFALFPWSDAGNYYRGAEELLETGRLSPWNCRRPLATVLLAVNLKATGHDIQAVQLVQAVLMGFAAYALSGTVGRNLGRPAGLMAFAVLFAFGRRYASWLLSEWIGLTLGALAVALLWNGSRDGRKAMLWWGTAALTLALNARAGTFLVLPALVLWAGFAFSGERSFNRGAAATILTGILFGFLVNGTVMKIYGDRFGPGHGNFSMTLYGLAAGKPGWQQIYLDFPESRGMQEDALMDFAYRKSFERIVRDPSGLAAGLAAASKNALYAFPDLPGMDSSLTGPKFIRWFIAPLLLACAFVFIWRFRRRPEVTMTAASLAGYMSSVPFLWTDGGDRAYAATIPVLGVFLSFGICGWKGASDLPLARMPAGEGPRRSWPLAVAVAALVAVAVTGPAVAIRAAETAPVISLPGLTAGESAVIRSDSPRVTVLRPGAPESTFVPRVSRIDYLRNLPAFATEDFRRLPRPGVVYYARNLLAPKTADLMEKYIWVVGPGGMTLDKSRYLLLRGSYRRETNVFTVSDFSALVNAPD